MPTPLAELINILSPKQVDEFQFQGIGSENDGVPATYGGHFIGQATAAASATVAEGQAIHSLHAYFLRGGKPGEAIEYAVEQVRDGATFATRRVRASQNGKTNFELSASFTLPADSEAIEAQPRLDLSTIPKPGELPPYHELMAGLDPLPLPEAWALREHGIDVRVVHAPWTPLGPSADAGICMWIRANGQMPDQHKLHTAALAYQSDESLADNLLIPFGITWGMPGIFCVSLDHAMWFHRPIDLNEWHFVEQRPISLAHERGIAHGDVWNAKHQLVASFTQEVLLRH